VLIVDDNDVNRMVASGLVTALGYDVVCASDGLDAIEQCKTSPPDVVLMDVNMPVLDGIDATRRLRELQRCGRVAPFAIVAATAAADDDTERSCRDAGMDGFLSKPLRLPQIRTELRRVTAHRARS
jgi:CheY-like chemotaxis protein